MFVRRGFVVLALWSCACALDERKLLPADDDSWSSGSSGDSPGQGGAADRGPSTGGSTSAGRLVNGCADLDTDGQADCDSTLVQNPSFTMDTSDWTPDANSEFDWDAQNALGDDPSGSAKLTSASSRASAAQCVQKDGQWLWIAYADALVDPGDGTDDPSQAALEVAFFDSSDCSGTSSGGFFTPPSRVSGSWTIIQAGNVSSETTASVSITLVVARKTDADVSAYFDNVMLKPKGL